MNFRFLVEDPQIPGTYVFTLNDPRTDGYEGRVEEDITLEYNEAEMRETHGENDSRVQALGVSMANPRHYRVFRDDCRLHEEGFRVVARGLPMTCSRWRDYLDLRSSQAITG